MREPAMSQSAPGDSAMGSIPSNARTRSGRAVRRSRSGRHVAGRRLWVLASVTVATLAVACAPPPADPVNPPPGPVVGIGQRTVTTMLSGATSYSRTATATAGSVDALYQGGLLAAIEGTIEFPGAAGGTATLGVDLVGGPTRYTGEVTLTDPSAGVDVTIAHDNVPVTTDDDADASSSATEAGTTISWGIATVDATGLEAALDDLAALEANWCGEAQRDLVGLSTAELPDSEMIVTQHQSRSDFTSSKAELSPLAVQGWGQPAMATTANGNTVTLSHHLSCKTKSADALAVIGQPTSTDGQCALLSQKSVDLARALMTPAELGRYDADGPQIVPQLDREANSGPDWLAEFDDAVLVGGTLELTANSLLIEYNDPAWQGLPENLRGLHYCTVWSPAWSYWWMTEGAFAT